MKVQMTRWMSRKFVAVVGLAAFTLVGCGDESDPEAVTIDELRGANGLTIVDNGNGSVTLQWRGMNNESDFTGYNIYGAKNKFLDSEGTSIQLLNETGDALAAGKETLAQMAYNGTDWETAGTATNNDGDFSFYPFYVNSDEDKPILPSCVPQADQSCTAPTTDTAGTTTTLNGLTSYTFTGLKADGYYCFVILATLDGGKKVSQSSSPVRCVYPRSESSATGVVSVAGTPKALDLDTLKTTCGASHACETATVATLDAGACGTDTTQEVCIETFNSVDNFTAGKDVGVQDLGYYPNGFDSDFFTKPVPKLSTFGTVQNKDGYSVAGQSLKLADKHIYIVAQASTDPASANFFYHFIYVTANASSGWDMKIRPAQIADVLK